MWSGQKLASLCCMYSGSGAGAPGLDFETWDSPVLKSPPITFTYKRHHALGAIRRTTTLSSQTKLWRPVFLLVVGELNLIVKSPSQYRPQRQMKCSNRDYRSGQMDPASL